MLTTLLLCFALGVSTPSSTHAAIGDAVREASAALDDWQLEAARAAAERLLWQAPEDAGVQLLAAEVLHQQGRHEAAIGLWRAAGPAAGSRYAQLAPVLLASGGYAPYFQTTVTPHFTIRSMDKDAIVAAYAVTVLEAAYSRIGQDLGFLPAERGEPIVVEIYPDARGLAGATGLSLKEIETSGTIAVCKFHRLMITSPLATADGYAWADTLAHEFVHLIVSKRTHNNIPIWLHEGIAKYFESRWKSRAGEALSPYGEKLLATAVAKDSLITFKQMHPSMAKLPSQDDAALAFAEVFTVVEHIVKEHGTGAIADILRRVGQGQSLEAAMDATLHLRLDQLESAWRRALRRRAFRRVPDARPEKVRLAEAPADASAAPALEDMADKQVHDWARLGELLQLRHRPQAAIVEYEKALAAAGTRYATLVNLLARAYIEVDKMDKAEALLARSLTQHPEDSDAHLLAGRIALKREQWEAACGHYEAVRLQNPFNPEIHGALAQLYARRGDTGKRDQETVFLALAQKPRPATDTSPAAAKAPPLLANFGALRVLGQPWGPVAVDAGPAQLTPLWDLPVPAGPHQIASAAPGSPQLRVQVTAGATTVFRLHQDVNPAQEANMQE